MKINRKTAPWRRRYLRGIAGWNRPGRRGQSGWQHRYAIAAGAVIQTTARASARMASPGADELMRMAQTVTATVGGAAAQVLYARQAPGNRSDYSKSTS
jgi:hypothetical protein